MIPVALRYAGPVILVWLAVVALLTVWAWGRGCRAASTSSHAFPVSGIKVGHIVAGVRTSAHASMQDDEESDGGGDGGGGGDSSSDAGGVDGCQGGARAVATGSAGVVLSTRGRITSNQTTARLSAHPRRNVLLIIADDLRPQLGTYGHRNMITPNLDKLASQSLVFTRAYCQAPSCNPSRHACMRARTCDPAGKHPHPRAEVPAQPGRFFKLGIAVDTRSQSPWTHTKLPQ